MTLDLLLGLLRNQAFNIYPGESAEAAAARERFIAETIEQIEENYRFQRQSPEGGLPTPAATDSEDDSGGRWNRDEVEQAASEPRQLHLWR